MIVIKILNLSFAAKIAAENWHPEWCPQPDIISDCKGWLLRWGGGGGGVWLEVVCACVWEVFLRRLALSLQNLWTWDEQVCLYA